ncbi:uncharacterized protein LOC106011234 [Aplysia californica]|uniref:Uncharacterized protein LOC106011234 n=1 Tax=Aplysia californica TaxID=6500 RepID=A0ABM0ZVT5_APLCA|nr:uncharacterized protein LOC106011234 [Aplysia californica]
MSGTVGNATALRNLAEDLLTSEENGAFREALGNYRQTGSLPSLVKQLSHVIKTTEKLMLLVEISSVLSQGLRADFHKLCCLYFPTYETFLTYFTPGSVGQRSRVITKDASGQFHVVSSGRDKNFYTPSDQRSLFGESGIDVNSDVDDISRHGADASLGGYQDNTWKIESKSKRSHSTSSHDPRLSRSDGAAAISGDSGNSLDQSSKTWRQSQPSLGQGHGSISIRNRARSLRILSGSLPTVIPAQGTPTNARRAEGRARVLLKRQEDGSLGMGIQGGKEYNSPISVYSVEPGSQGDVQGLRVGDEILDVNGTDFSDITHAEAVTLIRNAWNVILTVHRSGSSNNDLIDGGQLTSAGEEIKLTVYPSKKGKLGCGVHRKKEGRVVVTKVEKHSAAAKAGVCKGDVFLEIDDIKVATLTDKQVACLTSNVKRVRLKILRKSGKESRNKRPQTLQQEEFDNMFSPLTLDLSPLGLDSDEDDLTTFASSTPRRPSRSQSEENRSTAKQRQGMQQEMRTRSISQLPSDRKYTIAPEAETRVKFQVEVEVHQGSTHGEESAVTDENDGILDKERLRSTPSPPSSRSFKDTNIVSRENGGCNKINHISNNDSSSNNNEDDNNNNNNTTNNNNNQMNVVSSTNSNTLEKPYPELMTIGGQQRMYRPRVVTVPNHNHHHHHHYHQQHRQHSPHGLQPRGGSAHHPHQSAKPLGRYIQGPQAALPSRLAMMYSPNTNVAFSRGRDRERTPRAQKKTASSSSASSKMKIIRNRSHSPQVTARPQRDREFLKAIQNSVERRQRAHRLSLYQLPDQDDDVWNIS